MRHACSESTSCTEVSVCVGHAYLYKLYKRNPAGIDFVKHYHAHLGAVHDLQVSADGQRLCTTSADNTIKFYDVVGFDMILCGFSAEY